MNESFSIQDASSRRGVRVFRLFGRLDARAAASLAGRCRAECRPANHLVLVLSGVEFLSSSGVGTLLSLTEEFRESGAILALAAPSEAVSMAIGLLNLGDFLAIHASEEDAAGRAAA